MMEPWFPLGDWRWAIVVVAAFVPASIAHRHEIGSAIKRSILFGDKRRKRWRDARIQTTANVDATVTLTGGLVGSIGGTASLGPPNPWRYPLKWFRWSIARIFVLAKRPTPRAGRGESGTVSVAGIEGQGESYPGSDALGAAVVAGRFGNACVVDIRGISAWGISFFCFIFRTAMGSSSENSVQVDGCSTSCNRDPANTFRWSPTPNIQGNGPLCL